VPSENAPWQSSQPSYDGNANASPAKTANSTATVNAFCQHPGVIKKKSPDNCFVFMDATRKLIILMHLLQWVFIVPQSQYKTGATLLLCIARISGFQAPPRIG
jgi:hypothetical protein